VSAGETGRPDQSPQTVQTPTTGATQADWDYFELLLGVGEDMLPAVQASAVPSEHSNVAPGGFGKIPSRYKSPTSNEATGIAKWQTVAVTSPNIDRWRTDPRYSICLRTSAVRALDCDVTDPALAARIAECIDAHLPGAAKRVRSNSPKFLVPFFYKNALKKQVIKTAAGKIELLADGQHFIAAGLHPSGVRHEWNPVPREFPTLKTLDALWTALAEQFAVEPAKPLMAETSSAAPQGKRAAPLDIDKLRKAAFSHDPNCSHDNWIKIGQQLHDGSNGSNDGLAIWVDWSKAATGKNEDGSPKYPGEAHLRGRWKTFSSEGKRAVTGEALIGDLPAEAEEFEVLPDAAPAPEPLGRLVTRDGGSLIPNVQNAEIFTRSYLRGRLNYDEFLDRILIHWPGEQRRPWVDSDAVRLQIAMQSRGMTTMSKQAATDAAELVAHTTPANCVQEYLLGLKWDGAKRLTTWLHHAFGTPTDKYHLRAGRNFLVAMCARAMQPGCQVDEVLVLEGEQGMKKTAALRAIGAEYFKELTARPDSHDFEQQLKGVWLGEFSELATIKRPEDIERIKQFITNNVDHYRRSYGRTVEDFPRRVVFAATTNGETWLNDPTGGRRFNPVAVERVNLEWIRANRDQLFAEALRDFTAGRKWWVMPAIAREHQAARAVEDPWEQRIEDYLRGREGSISTIDVLQWGLNVEPAQQTKSDLTRVGITLTKLGCNRTRVSKDGRQQWRRIVPPQYAAQKKIIGFEDELIT
jgi:hypothetical protein